MQNADSKAAAQLVTHNLLTGQSIPNYTQKNVSRQEQHQAGHETSPQGPATVKESGQPYQQEQATANEQPGQPFQQEQPSGQGQIIANRQPEQTNPQTNTNEQIYLEDQHEEPVQFNAGDDKADFTHVYRTGNFGKHFGRVNKLRGKRWVYIHGALTLLMFIFTLAASIMMNDFKKNAIHSILLAISWMTTITDWFTVVAAAFFIWRLSNLRHPLSTLMTMRFSAVFNFVFNLFFFLVLFLGALLSQKNFMTLTKSEVNAVKALYVLISLLMMVKIVTGWSFLFLWWACPSCCHGCAPYCIFEEGYDLAPGVENSAGTENIILFGQLAGAVAQEMNRR